MATTQLPGPQPAPAPASASETRHRKPRRFPGPILLLLLGIPAGLAFWGYGLYWLLTRIA